MSTPPISEHAGLKHKYPDNTDDLFDRIQGKTMTRSIEIFNAYMDRQESPRQKSEWETIWPRISLALIQEIPDVEFPDPTASFEEIRAFLLSKDSQEILLSVLKIDLSGLDIQKVPPLLLRCKNLEILDLSSNPKLRDIPEWLIKLEKLETLDIENTGIREIPPTLAIGNNRSNGARRNIRAYLSASGKAVLQHKRACS